MDNYKNYTNEQLRDYIINTRKNAAQFDREGSYSIATTHYNEATRAEYALTARFN